MAEQTKLTPPFMKHALRILLQDIIILIIILALFEFISRAFIPSSKELVFSDEITAGHQIVLNSLHLRDDEIKPDFPESAVRILVLGDSVAFGTGIAAEDTFSSMLEKSLQARGDGLQYDVINAGGQGNELSRSIDFVKEHGLDMHPDVVIQALTASYVVLHGKKSQVTSSPTMLSLVNNIPSRIHLFLYEHLISYVVFDFIARQSPMKLGIMKEDVTKMRGYTLAFAFDVPGVDEDYSRKSYQYLEHNLAVLNEILDEKGIRLVLLYVPIRFEISEKRWDNSRNVPLDKIRIHPGDYFQRMADRLQLPYQNMIGPFQDQRKKMAAKTIPFDTLYIPIDTVHPDKLGHAVIAEQIEKMLVQQKIIPEK